ncbi:MAG: DUF4922 domain-containing protein, partial [Muribaculaceae bacterium]|nr:DUF4922 domain-containing protein [Muribaculaceae bacterium]
MDTVAQSTDGTLLKMSVDTPVLFFAIEATSPEAGQKMFDTLYRAMPVQQGDTEPMMNILCRANKDSVTAIVIPRKRHRPTFYGEGEGCMLISPASVDLGGVLITPRKADFDLIDRPVIERILAELCLGKDEMNAISQSIRQAL